MTHGPCVAQPYNADLLAIAGLSGTGYLQRTGAATWSLGSPSSVPTAITVANEATDTTCFVGFFTAATGDLGPKTNTGLIFNSATGALSPAQIIIGTGQTPFGAICIQQSTSGSYPSGWHAVEDFSIIQPSSGSVGYASFDARPTVTADMGHTVGFQSRPTVNGTLTDRLSAIDASPVFNTGTTPLVHGLLINDVIGTGTVTTDCGIAITSTLKGAVNNYGIKIGPVQNGSGVNWGIYCESKSRFLSSITVGASSPSSWSPINLGAANANASNRISVYENPPDGTFFRGIAMVNPGIYGLGLYGGTDSSLPTDSNADVVVATGGNVLIGSNTNNGAKLQVNGLITQSLTTPASASATGVAGTITADANYVYVCTATNTWKRVAIATW